MSQSALESSQMLTDGGIVSNLQEVIKQNKELTSRELELRVESINKDIEDLRNACAENRWFFNNKYATLEEDSERLKARVTSLEEWVSECWRFYAVPTAKVIFTAKTSLDVFCLSREQVLTFSVLGDRIYEMRCLFVAVGHNARFIVLPHWDNMS